jgi:hypothetical protein
MREVIYFELFAHNCMNIIITGRFFFQITIYQGFRNNQAHLYEIFLLGTQVQTKIRITVKFRIIKFQINQVLLYYKTVQKCNKIKVHVQNLTQLLTITYLQNSSGCILLCE